MDASAWAAWYAAVLSTIVLVREIHKSGGLTAITKRLSRTISLEDAAQQFYQVARYKDSYWAVAADGTQEKRTEQEKLIYCAHALTSGEIEWTGVCAPSKLREKIEPKDVKHGSFINGLDRVMGRDGRTVFRSVRLDKKGLRKLIRRLDEGHMLFSDKPLDDSAVG
ncbi:hypothetical protein [Variovorax sp. HJSM1_2]|uniref:hypothetical protein n=1 Tax=Variovorax sp. HJSM1_2 TaxID=3366263 RepID=UPI003BBB5D58